MKKDYMLSWCTDFHDELVYSWFNEKRLKKLFSLLQSWGMKRMYWVDVYPWKEGKFDMSPYGNVRKNALRTYENIGDFLPAAVKVAHDLGMEFYSVYKPFDFGFFTTLPFKTAEGNKYGKLDNLSGKMYWALNSLKKLQDKRLKRHPADLPKGVDKMVVSTIKLTASDMGQTTFGKDNIKLLTSDNNGNYLPYKKDFTYRHGIENSKRVIYLENLKIKAPFFAIQCTPLQQAGIFSNTLDQLVKLYDSKGNEIPFTYGLSPRNQSTALKSPFKKSLLEGYNFDNGGVFDNGLRNTSHAIDAPGDGITAFAKGKQAFISGALSPAWPESRRIWMDHIRFALESGVDGVDFRAANHNRTFEWERYGFEKPVVQAYKKKYGIDITREAFSTANHRRILGEFYTRYLQEGMDLVHSYGKKTQVHILAHQIYATEGNHYMNFAWDWKKWLRKLPVDSVTVKDGPWFDESVCNPIRELTENRGKSVFFCPYWKSLVSKTQWQKKLFDTLKKSKSSGQAGFILYESSMVIRMDSNGKIKLLDPELPEIFRRFMK